MHRLLVALACVAVASCASTAPRTPARAPNLESAPHGAARATVRVTWADVDAMEFPEPQTAFARYGAPVRRALWQNIYRDGGVELYCRERFTGAEASTLMLNGLELELEHVYPADSIAEAFHYTNRSCNHPIDGESPTARDERLCRAAAGDLFNLFAAYGPINGSRGNLAYAELEGQGTNNPNYADVCPDFERGRIGDTTYVEPDNRARGDIARALIYMHEVYDLPYARVIRDRDLLLAWANDDPVDGNERRREQRIRALQPGSWNPLIAPHGAAS